MSRYPVTGVWCRDVRCQKSGKLRWGQVCDQILLSEAVRRCSINCSFTAVRGHIMFDQNQTDTPLLTLGLLPRSGVLMTMRKCKLAILAIAVLLQVHAGAQCRSAHEVSALLSNHQTPRLPRARFGDHQTPHLLRGRFSDHQTPRLRASAIIRRRAYFVRASAIIRRRAYFVRSPAMIRRRAYFVRASAIIRRRAYFVRASAIIRRRAHCVRASAIIRRRAYFVRASAIIRRRAYLVRASALRAPVIFLPKTSQICLPDRHSELSHLLFYRTKRSDCFAKTKCTEIFAVLQIFAIYSVE